MVLKYEKYDTSWSGLIMAFKSIGLSNRELVKKLWVSDGTIKKWVKMNFFVLSSRFSMYLLVAASERKDQLNYENCHQSGKIIVVNQQIIFTGQTSIHSLHFLHFS